MKLNKGIIYLPKNRKDLPVKYLCICAHQDDCEIMAIHGILKGYYSKSSSFALVETTDGRGSVRNGKYKNFSDTQMMEVRIKEQELASEIGRYHSLYMLNYSSSEAKDDTNEDIINEYIKIIKDLKPEVIYTHSILDKHKTHVAVAIKVIEAIKRLDNKDRPKVIYGCEVWRSLDWIKDERKIGLDVSRNKRLQKKLLSCFESQNLGGKDYINSTIGRRYQNATYYRSHDLDGCKMMSYVVDLKPLVDQPNLTIKEYALSFVDDLQKEVEEMFKK